MAVSTLNGQLKKGISEVFRRAYIKRMKGDGTYEANWQDISDDVKKWGTLTREIDSVRLNNVRFSSLKLTMENSTGRYNTHTDDNSIWLGYANQQRTLVKIETGFVHATLTAAGIWDRDEHPNAQWDSSKWDGSDTWDNTPIMFMGVVYGDMGANNSNEITFNVMPTIDVFRQYPAKNLTGWDNSMTASRFVEMVRDQTVGGSYIFRPFFGDTSTGFNIQTTTAIYSNLNTSAAADIQEMTVWQVIEKLAEAENYAPFVTTDGQFNFVSRSALTSTSQFSFLGQGSNDRTTGQTIKKINYYGPRSSKYYSRVQVKWVDASTTTSYEVVESSFAVSGTNTPWVLGHKTLNIENFWIPSAAVAATLATAIFNDYSANKNEIDFITSFVPHLELLQPIKVTYDSSPVFQECLWDYNNWGDDTMDVLPQDLVWDYSAGDGLKLTDEQFVLIAIKINLDSMECNFIGRKA